MENPTENAKKIAGYHAAELIPPGKVIGLGTGSTVFYFIEKLIKRHREGLKLQVVASSKQSQKLAEEGGIPFLDIETIESIDITVDGADEIDPKKQMIKGGGGAHVREKIVANMSEKMIIIVDEAKLSPHLGKRKLPVEIVPFAHEVTRKKLIALGYKGTFRTKEDGTPFITDNQNFILDIALTPEKCSPREDHLKITSIPGVVDTGFFFDLADQIIIGTFDGKIEIRD